jgi:hypothetical protein
MAVIVAIRQSLSTKTEKRITTISSRYQVTNTLKQQNGKIWKVVSVSKVSTVILGFLGLKTKHHCWRGPAGI